MRKNIGRLKQCALPALAAALLLLSPAPPAFSQDAKGMPESIDIGSGSVGGGFYVQAGAIAAILEKDLKIPVSGQPTGGSRENVRLLDAKKIQLALIAANNGYPAYHGEGGYGKKYEILAPLLTLYPNPSCFVTLEGSGIKSFADLKGKRVGWPSRTWDETIIKPWFAFEGMDIHKDIKVVYGSFGDLYTQLGDGSVDAVVTSINEGKYPLPALSQLMVRKKVFFIPFDKSAVEKLVAATPYMGAFVIPAGRFGLKHDYLAVDIGGPSLYARRDMSDDAAYTITKIVHNNLKQLTERNKVFGYALENPKELSKNIGVPYHPGAIKYWKEVGMWQR